MAFDPKEYRYKYEKEHLKRIALDVRKEEYLQIKEHCEKIGLPVNRYIRNLIQSDINRTNPKLSDLMPEDVYQEFIKLVTSENIDLSSFFVNPIKKYIDKHKQPED